MKRTHALAVAVALGAAAVIGVLAVSKTATLGASGRRASDAAIAARSRRLDRFEASLRRALAGRPPALPKAPAVPAASPGGTAAPPQRVVFRRPPPVVVHLHGSHAGDDGGEGSDHEGGGGDD